MFDATCPGWNFFMKETSQKWLSGNCHFCSGAGMSKGITGGTGNMSGGLDYTISWRVYYHRQNNSSYYKCSSGDSLTKSDPVEC